MPVRLYSQEMKQWLRDNVKGRSLNQLTEDFNEHFGTSFKTTQIGHLKGDLNLRNGNDTKFKKGQEANNKGQKMSEAQREKLKNKWFQKGHKPVNYREIGTEYINTDGYVMVKVTHNKWRLKHKVVWEEHHGPIPKGYVIVFLDRNITNCNIENLKLVKRSTLTRLTTLKLRSDNSIATEAGINIIEIIEETKRRQKELKNNGYE
jgi:hypothetical protein